MDEKNMIEINNILAIYDDIIKKKLKTKKERVITKILSFLRY